MYVIVMKPFAPNLGNLAENDSANFRHDDREPARAQTQQSLICMTVKGEFFKNVADFFYSAPSPRMASCLPIWVAERRMATFGPIEFHNSTLADARCNAGFGQFPNSGYAE